MTAVPQDGDDRLVQTQLTAAQKILVRGTRYYHFRDRIAYSQARPTQLRLPRETTRLDCSGLVAACMDFAGVMPNVDWRYTNTWVQIQLGRQVAKPLPADVVFYGHNGNPTHEALYLGTLAQLRTQITVPAEVAAEMKGRGACVLSHGSYPMKILPVDYRGDRIQVRRLR